MTKGIFTIVLILWGRGLSAQYQTYDRATDLGNNTFQLTPDSANMAGSVWNQVAQNLNYPFSVSGQMFLGESDDAADGIVFVMQNECVSGGTVGGGIGYNGLSGASLGVEFDTWENVASGGDQDNNDPPYDHIGIQAFGNVKHQATGDSVLFLPEPLRTDSSNVEDSTWHDYEINWDPTSNTLDVYFEGVLRASMTRDIINDIFGGDSVIYFGFTSSTGGFWGTNSVQIDPIPVSGAEDQYICVGDTAIVDFINNTGGLELISIGKPIEASSYEGAVNPHEANDGNPGTRWASQWGNDPEWITIDLLDQYELDSISIRWEAAAATDYEIQVSADSSTWVTAVTVNDGVSNDVRGFGLSGFYRYVRVYGTARTLAAYGYSIWEIEVYGVAQIEWTSSPYLQFQGSDRIAFFPPVSTAFQVKIPDKCNGPSILDFWVYVDTISLAAQNQTICDGDSALLTVTPVGNYGEVNYVWDNGIGPGDSIFVSPGGTTTYEVIGVDSLGCSDTTNLDVTVNPVPVVTTSDDTTMCRGGSYTISATGGGTYNWNQGLGAGASHIVAPSDSTTYTVTVTTAGCSTRDSVQVNVNPLPMADAGADDSFCGGQDSVTITASGGDSYFWNNGLGAGASHTVSPASNTTYTVQVTDVNGCTDSDDIVITVNPLPVADAGANDSICVGQGSVTLTASGGSNYFWDNGLGAGASHIVSPALNTTYTVQVTDVNGCTDSDDVVITVNPLPVADAGANDSICVGQGSVTLTASGGNNYFWDNGLGAGASHIVSPASNTTYTVLVTDANGCTDSDSVVITVNPLPVADAGEDVTICITGSTVLNASGADSYNWDNGLGGGASHSVSPTSTTTYTVTAADINGCIDTDDVIVTVITSLPVDAGTDQEICLGDSISLLATGAVNYTWDNGLGVGDAHTVAPTTTTSYVVTGDDGNGCSETDDIVVTVNNLPVANAGADDSFCDGQGSVTITASGGITYNWDNALGGGPSHTVAPSSTTTYTVTVTDVNGCEDTDDVLISVLPLPDVNAGQDQVICEGDQTTLTATGAISYTWNSLGNGSNQVVQPEIEETYIVTGTDINGCTNSDDVIVSTQKCTCPLFIPNAISPNNDAANDEWIIEGIDCFDLKNVRVYNRYGGLVYESSNYQTPWNGKRNGEPMPVAVYYYVVEVGLLGEQPTAFTGTLTIMR